MHRLHQKLPFWGRHHSKLGHEHKSASTSVGSIFGTGGRTDCHQKWAMCVHQGVSSSQPKLCKVSERRDFLFPRTQRKEREVSRMTRGTGQVLVRQVQALSDQLDNLVDLFSSKTLESSQMGRLRNWISSHRKVNFFGFWWQAVA